MPDKDDNRRTFFRFEIPEASVQYKLSGNKLNSLKNYSNPHKLINISKSGISFDIKEKATYGDPIELKVAFSDGNKIKLKGKVRWSKTDDKLTQKTVGVLFNPFGSQKKYNPIKALEYLRTIRDKAIELNSPADLSTKLN